ncbi:MAG: hypothetical protein Tsb004_15560 [Allomuricauda sp.]
MLYIIGGASRSGKTLTAKKLSKRLTVPYLSLDWLVMGFGNGVPEYGIHHMLMPDDIAERMWSFLRAMCEAIIINNEDCVVDGEAVLPELLIGLMDKYPDRIRACFLGYTYIAIPEKVKEVLNYTKTHKDWIHDKSEAYVTDHIENMIHHSLQIRESCNQHNIRYFDTSQDFMMTLNSALEYMSI